MDYANLGNELLGNTEEEALPVEEEVVERTYSNVYGQSDNWDKGAGDLLYADHEHYNQNLTVEATVDDLQSLYSANTDMQEMFGDFDTYLSYMDERQDLIDSGVPVDFIGSIGEQASASAEDQAASAQLQQLVLAEAQGTITPEQAAQKAELEAAGVVPSLGMPGAITGGGEDHLTSQEAYDAMMANEEMTALNEKYGIPSGPYQNDRGDTVMWTGSGQVVHTPYNKSFAHDVLGPVLFQLAAGILSGPASSALVGLTGPAHSALASAIANIVGKGGTGGDLTLEGILKGMITAGASTAILDQVKNAIQTGDGILADIGGWMKEQTDKLMDTKVVTMPDGTIFKETADGWLDAAGTIHETIPAGGETGIISGILGNGGELPDWVWSTAETVTDVIEAAEDVASGNGNGPSMGEGGATTLPDLTPEVEPEEAEEETEEEEILEEEEEILEEEEEILEEEEEEPILPPEVIEEIEEEEEVEEEQPEEVVEIIGEDPDKDGGILGGIFGSIFDSVPEQPDDLNEEEEEEVVIVEPDDPGLNEEEEEETIVVEPPPEDPPSYDPGSDDLNEEDEETIVIPPEVTNPPPSPGPTPGGGGGGGGEGGGGEGGEGDGTQWSELFSYTNIVPPQLSKYAPQIAAVKGMFNDIS